MPLDLLFSQAIQSAPVGLFLTDPEGRCLRVNRAWSELSGVTAEEALGEGWLSALHPQDALRVAEAWETAARGERAFREEYRFRRPDGSVSWVEGQARELRDESGAVQGYVGVVIDITERKRAQHAAAEATRRAQSELLASVSHEIRTPLNGVLGLLELAITEADPGAPSQRERLVLAQRSAGSLLRILNDLLGVAEGPRAAAATEPAPAFKPLPPLRVLLVEDNAVNRLVATGLLEQAGHRVWHAEDGNAALQILGACVFDVVLMDIQMPKLDGLAATRLLRQREGAGRRTPVVALTARAGAQDRAEAVAAGVDAYLTKPFRSEELAEVIRQALEGKAPPASAPGASDRRPALAVSLGSEVYDELVQLFIEQYRAARAELLLGVDQQRAGAVAAVAHRLAGSLGVLGALSESRQARELERLSERGNLGAAASLAVSLVEQVDRFCKALSEEATQGGASFDTLRTP